MGGGGWPTSVHSGNQCSNDYMPLNCPRRSPILNINVDPSALGSGEFKQEVVPVDDWLDLFMICQQ